LHHHFQVRGTKETRNGCSLPKTLSSAPAFIRAACVAITTLGSALDKHAMENNG